MESPLDTSSRSLVWAFALLTISIVAVILMTRHLIEQDSQRLVERFEQGKRAQMQDVLRLVEENLRDVTDDLRFLSRLVVEAPDAEREAFLQALLGGVSPYIAGAIVNSDGVAQQVIIDPRSGELPDREDIRAMEEAGVLALKEETAVSPRSERQLNPWHRAFAQRTATGEAVVLLVNTQEFLAELRILSSDPQTNILVLGPQGYPAPATSPPIFEVMKGEVPKELELVLEKMRSAESGTFRISGKDAEWVGFEFGDVVVAYGPVFVRSGVFWSVASFSSLASIRNAERAVATRLVGFSSIIVLLILSFGVFGVAVSRRTVVLRERLQIAGELSRLHEKAHRVVQAIPVAVGILDQSMKISDRNESFASRFGDDDFVERLHAQNSPVAALLESANKTRESLSHVVDGTFFGKEGVFQVYCVPVEPPTSDANVIMVIEDVSALRQLESQLLRVEKLATVGVLAAGIAHEIGTPLGVVRGRAEFIQRKLGPENPHASGLEVIISQIDRISRSIQDLLDFSRLRETTVEPVNLLEAVRTVEGLLIHELDSTQIQVQIPENLPMIAANADQLQQILVNLVMNSADALHDREDGRISVDAQYDDGCVCFAVCDNGTGIPDAHIHQVFDPFFTTKKRGQGTGLGLSIVTQIVRNHGAELELKSSPEGTEFRFKWPVWKQETK